MQEMETYDTMQVVKRQQDNQRLKRDLDHCRNGLHHTIKPTQTPHGISQNSTTHQSVESLPLFIFHWKQSEKNASGYAETTFFDIVT